MSAGGYELLGGAGSDMLDGGQASDSHGGGAEFDFDISCKPRRDVTNDRELCCVADIQWKTATGSSSNLQERSMGSFPTTCRIFKPVTVVSRNQIMTDPPLPRFTGTRIFL